MTRAGDSPAARVALAWIAAFAAARFALMLGLGLGVDETYTIVISRKLALSYFDHPPLHQWITHFAALAFGETVWVRLPFVVLFALTGWLLFVLTRDLFGYRAALIALFAVNVSPFFLASAGGWVVPDGTLLFALAAAALALARLLFRQTSPRAAWGLWLSAGFCFGIAGLSKYSAALPALGTVAFLALSPRHRRWFAHPAPYCGALLAIAMFTPVLLWNAEHGWVSFLFQGVRASPAGKWRPWQFLAVLLGEIAYLTPWIFAGLVGGLAMALKRQGRADERRLFLACLALPAIVVFSLTPLWGARGYPHWAMPGWFFAYSLMGARLSRRPQIAEPASPSLRAQRSNPAGPAAAGVGLLRCARNDGGGFHLKRWAWGSAAAMAAFATLVVSQNATGWIDSFAGDLAARDPTLELLAWTPLARAPALRASPDFVVATDWSSGAKIALALGPRVRVFVFSHDPRGMAAPDESVRWIGRDAVIVAARGRLPDALEVMKDYFDRLDPPQYAAFGRGGRDEIALALVPAHGLTHAFPVPYPQ